MFCMPLGFPGPILILLTHLTGKTVSTTFKNMAKNIQTSLIVGKEYRPNQFTLHSNKVKYATLISSIGLILF